MRRGLFPVKLIVVWLAMTLLGTTTRRLSSVLSKGVTKGEAFH